MSEAIAPAAEAMPEMADAFLSVPQLLLMRVQAWDEMLKMPQPSEKLAAQTAMWRYARMMALLARATAQGRREELAFEAVRKKIPAEQPWGTLNTSGDVLALVGEIIAARLSATPAESLPHWEKAVGLQDALVYDEPPAWNYPVRESLGAALVRAGRGAEAEKIFREGLKRSPRNGWMMFGVIEAMKAQGKSDGMDELKHELDAAWAKADLRQTLDAM